MVASNERRFDDVKFLNDPNHWPCWPVCPVKRYQTAGGRFVCGVVITDIPIVYETDMFALSGMTSADIKALRRHEYGSMEELVADGWLVD